MSDQARTCTHHMPSEISCQLYDEHCLVAYSVRCKVEGPPTFLPRASCLRSHPVEASWHS